MPEIRCFWCTRWMASEICAHCEARAVPPDLFPAARYLVDAGVDRLSLPDRVRALPLNEVERYTRKYRAQLDLLRERVNEIALIEPHLLIKGWAQHLEDWLVLHLPMSQA